MTNQHVEKRYDESRSGMPTAQTRLIFRRKLCCSKHCYSNQLQQGQSSQKIFKQNPIIQLLVKISLTLTMALTRGLKGKTILVAVKVGVTFNNVGLFQFLGSSDYLYAINFFPITKCK